MRKLETTIYNTVRYFDIFDMPVTATQIWQYLVVADSFAVAPSLIDIQQELKTSFALKGKIGSKWGYYFLSGKEQLVRKRLRRHVLAQDKWKIARRAAHFLALAPFVQGLAGSGSLAIDNTKQGSDLDLFVIVRAKRIWTARLGLLIFSQLTGRRRKYWDQEAPDKICLNHYVAADKLEISPHIQNVYTAMLYASLVPVAGANAVRHFQEANAQWMRRYVNTPSLLPARHWYTVFFPRWVKFVKRLMENVLLEPVGDLVEYGAEKIQRWVIEKHQRSSRSGRVALSRYELAFHPDTKVPAILHKFYQH